MECPRGRWGASPVSEVRIEVLDRVRLDEGAFAKREVAYLKLQQVTPIGMFELEM